MMQVAPSSNMTQVFVDNGEKLQGTMLASMALFISSLATAAPSRVEPITSVKTVHAGSIPFPDVYMCYDFEFASL